MAETETVYGTQDDSRVMSERVQTLAASIYKEFERMLNKYDEDVVKELMPLVVGILENLDLSYQEKQENEVELELIRDDNEQLLTQYEREKQLRKGSEQKLLEVEDATEEENKELQSKLESLESIVRMFELKAKNAQDHISRLEDKESEMKREYTKLHDRYTELFKTHMEHIDRTKMIMGADRIMEMANSPRGRGFQLPNLRPVGQVTLYNSGDTPGKPEDSLPGFGPTTPSRTVEVNASLKQELGDLEKSQLENSLDVKQRKSRSSKTCTTETGQITDSIDVKEISTGTKHTSQQPQSVLAVSNATEHAQQHDTSADVVVKATTPEVVSEPGLVHAVHTDSTSGLCITQAGLDDILQTPELEDIDESGFGRKSASEFKKSNNESSIFDEVTFQDVDALGEIDDGHDITGMSKEVENLILENTELLATKNALNVVKDDLIAKVDELTSEQEILREEINSLQTAREKLKKRVAELEEDLKKTKENLEKEKHKAVANPEEEDDVPMAQRKRFTRVEMARVLMERNQYKERLMELQEAVRWTEMIRASREHPDIMQSSKKKSSLWNFFSNLFSSSNKPPKRPTSTATVRYSAPTTNVRPVGDPNKKNRDKYNMGEKAKAYDFLQDDVLAEKARKEREKERREQYKQVRAHVKKDDGRMQAYGWSLPAKFPAATMKELPSSKTHVPVPVPVYCRPLLQKESDMKIWCAAGVNLTGGKTRDGGTVVGASVFYSSLQSVQSENKQEPTDDVEKLDKELQEHEKGVKEVENEQRSSFVWICTTTQNSSCVTVIDANNPADILESFHVTSSHILCIASVPGAMENDYPADKVSVSSEPEVDAQEMDKVDDSAPSEDTTTTDNNDGVGIGGVTFVQCATGTTSKGPSPDNSPFGSPSNSDLAVAAQSSMASAMDSMQPFTSDADATSDNVSNEIRVTKATGSPATSGHNTPSPARSVTGSEKRLLNEPNELVKDGINVNVSDNDLLRSEVNKMSSVLPTMWMGTQSGSLYVHSAVARWRKCLHSVKLKDSVLAIIHVKGRVFVALADGSVAVFHRATDGQWDLMNYHLIDLGKPHHSVRCMTVIANKHVWCGYRNKIHVLHPQTLKLQKSFDAHPRKESQIRQLSWVGDGVWVSIRLDSTLRLYHAYTHQHLQDVDIEPYVSKMLGTGKLGFSFVRITSLLVSCNRLWIGTGNGVIISVPLSESNRQSVTTNTAGRPGGVIRVYSDTRTDNVTPGSFIPYCSMAQAQLSFHGHKDAVKFFAAVPGFPSKGVSGVATTMDGEKDKEDNKENEEINTGNKNMLVLSGGEGYIDFRMGDTDEDSEDRELEKSPGAISKGDSSHLIVWQVFHQK